MGGCELREDHRRKVDAEKARYERQFLEMKIAEILERTCEKGKTIAIYGGEEQAKVLIPLLPEDISITYVIDQAAKCEFGEHIYPTDIHNHKIDIVILCSWYFRKDMLYELHRQSYTGAVIDIYEELKQQKLYLCQPFHKYSVQRLAGEKGGYPAPEALVEFYLIDAFEIYQFLPVYRKLKERGVSVKFIAEPNEINTGGNWLDFSTSVNILEELNLDYDVVCNPECKFAVTTQMARVLSKYCGKKIRYAYGNGMWKQAMSNSERVIFEFDCSFVAGEWRERLLRKYVTTQTIVQMGYPKYLDFFKERPMRGDVLERLHIHTDRKILCYYPTWGENSTIGLFGPCLRELRQDYFIVSKAHHCTSRLDEEQHNRDILSEVSDIVLPGNFDFALSTLIGDINICDAASGAATEVLYLNENAEAVFVYDNKKNDMKERLFEEIFQLGPVVTEPAELITLLRTGFPAGRLKKYHEKRNDTIEFMFGKRGVDYTGNILAVFQ